MATDYDKDEVTDREKLAAERQQSLAKYDANSVANQLEQQIYTYDLADKQNKALRDLQLKQNKRKAEADRFEAMRQLQNAALGLFSSAGSAMNGSTTGNMMSMLRNRNDADNSTYWQQLQENNDAVNNAYEESYDQNQIARRDAAVNATKALRDINSSLSANLSNINPNLYAEPGKASVIDSGNNIANAVQAAVNGGKSDTQLILDKVNEIRKGYKLANANQPTLSGYIVPPNAEQAVIGKRNRLRNNDYFSNLINGYNY